MLAFRPCLVVALVAALAGASLTATAQVAGTPKPPALAIRALGERTVTQIPPGPLHWRVDTFPDLAAAQAATGPHALAVEAAGKAWRFTLVGAGESPAPAGSHVATVGPIVPVAATTYLLRINEATGAPGATTPVHSHPGSEAFLVLAGEQTIRGEGSVLTVRAGQAEAGQLANRAMQVSSTGTSDLHALVMFVVDATRPFSSPATLP